jgi:hypothetical protein
VIKSSALMSKTSDYHEGVAPRLQLKGELGYSKSLREATDNAKENLTFQAARVALAGTAMCCKRSVASFFMRTKVM